MGRRRRSASRAAWQLAALRCKRLERAVRPRSRDLLRGHEQRGRRRDREYFIGIDGSRNQNSSPKECIHPFRGLPTGRAPVMDWQLGPQNHRVSLRYFNSLPTELGCSWWWCSEEFSRAIAYILTLIVMFQLSLKGMWCCFSLLSCHFSYIWTLLLQRHKLEYLLNHILLLFPACLKMFA